MRRYMIIYWRGGVYADADCTCKMPIMTWETHGGSVPCSFYAGMETEQDVEQVCSATYIFVHTSSTDGLIKGQCNAC